MMKSRLFLIIFFLMSSSNLLAQAIWQGMGGNLTEVNTVTVNQSNPQIIYAGTDRCVFKSEDGGANWKTILSVKGDYTKINFIANLKAGLFVASGNGLFFSANQGSSWDKVFKGKDELERNCLYLEASHNKLFLGTQAGLFISEDKFHWQKTKGELGDKEIRFVLVNPQDENILYALNPNTLYKSKDRGYSWDKIYISANASESNAAAYTPWDSEDEEARNLKALALDESLPYKIYLAGESGVLKSEDAGQSWEEFVDGSLPRAVRFLKVVNGELFAATKEGVFKFEGNNWSNIYKGLGDNNAYWLASDSLGTIVAATKAGIFKLNTCQTNFVNKALPPEALKFFDKEPSVHEIQKRAIQYNDVDNRKIADWRRRVRVRALMPEITLDYDKTVAYYGSSSGQFASFIGPRDWALQFKWDVAELLWNSYEDDIDSRARYMVQLRDDILDEVTRLYFERRRLQIELLVSPAMDEKGKLERDLRLQELTASLDALTGGYLSQKLAEAQKK